MHVFGKLNVLKFATKLLSFKDDRKTLIEKINTAYAAIDMKAPKLESGDEINQDLIKTLDLDLDFAEIAAQLNEIVKSQFNLKARCVV